MTTTWGRWIVLAELCVFVCFVAGFNLLQRLKGKKRLGELPIHPVLFAVGKLSMGTSGGFLLVQVAGYPLNLFPVPMVLEYVSAALLLVGLVFVICAFLRLGSDSRFGLSGDSRELRTTGIYSVSRNPMYLGFYLVTLASLLSVPHPANVCLGLVGIYVHHRVVLAEEEFLRQTYSSAYEAYVKRVRRYI
jgi:protein-S-isoprenylcysteine O-methyltransferase Ste14